MTSFKKKKHFEFDIFPTQGCGTVQSPTRVFTNNIVVRFHPGLEIDGDEVKPRWKLEFFDLTIAGHHDHLQLSGTPGPCANRPRAAAVSLLLP